MTLKASLRLAGLAALLGLAVAGCGRKSGVLKPWPVNTDPIVWQDAFTGLVEYYAFGNSKLDALGTDSQQQYDGTTCLRVTVPSAGGGYAGGAFVASEHRDLSGCNALTFMAKASQPVTIGEFGIGNDNAGGLEYVAVMKNTAVTTTWKKFTVPIPDPAKLVYERGLFFFSAAHQAGAGYTLWIDEVKFEKVLTISNPRPVMTSRTINWFVGATLNVSGTADTFTVEGANRVVEHSPNYFSYQTSDPSVATVSRGLIQVVGPGSATITARLGETPVKGSVNLTTAAFGPGQAPLPAAPAASVISLFSDRYAGAVVDKWSADWDVADVSDFSIFGDNLKLYTNLLYAGIEFISHPIDASAMTRFHMDVSVPSGTTFKIKLVDFGADGVFGGGDDSAHELTFNAASNPPVVNGTWISFDIPLTDFANLTSRAHLAQLILSGDTRTVYVDNIYFHK